MEYCTSRFVQLNPKPAIVNSIIDRQIDSPIPRPSDFVVYNGLKSRSTCSSPIPVPVSAIETSTSCSHTFLDPIRRIPGSSKITINSIEFVIRFISTCCSCIRLPRSLGGCSHKSSSSRMSYLCSSSRNRLTVSRNQLIEVEEGFVALFFFEASPSPDRHRRQRQVPFP